MRKHIILFFFPLFILSQTTAKVVEIKDGDTIVVLLENNEQKILRLAEVDCPIVTPKVWTVNRKS